MRATLHWVSAAHAIDAEVRLYDSLFTVPNPNDVPEGKTWADLVNPDSLTTLTGCKLEPSLFDTRPGELFQFERVGYFIKDPRLHRRPVRLQPRSPPPRHLGQNPATE